MERNLGMFTTYGIEYVYDYLGEERINSKIHELKNKPTMGIRLEEFAYGNQGYFSQTGALYVFGLLLYWFTDIPFVVFLYESSKNYNELNYYDRGILPIKWKEHLSLIDSMHKQQRITTAQYFNYTINKYWIDYHFFYFHLFEIIKNLIKEKQILELDVIGEYKIEKNKLIGKINLDIKIRRKPLTGQYLFYRKVPRWYDLQEIDSSEFEDAFTFKKDNDTYNLVLQKKENFAVIKVVEIDKAREIYKQGILTFNENEIMEKLILDYTRNVDKISNRYKIEQDALSSNDLVSNGCLFNIAEYYSSKGNVQNANEIVDINNRYSAVWRLLS